MSGPTPKEHEQVLDDLAAYALDALDEESTVTVERHLQDCEFCRRRLRWLQPAVDVLPASVEQHPPPERLRDKLLTTVRAEAGHAGHAADESVPARRRRWDLRGLALRPAVGFATVLLLVAGVATGYLIRGSEEPETTLVKAETPSSLARDVSATLERHGESATLHVQELPGIERDDVYQVWVQRAGTVEPASLFALRRDGSAEAAVPGPLEGAESVLVTREPRGGSQQPTSPPLLEAPLQ